MTAQSPHRNTSRPRRSTATRTVPTTVWASGTDPLPSGDHWPEPILSRAVREFSRVGDRVLLLGWPAPAARGGLALTPPDAGAALATIEGLDREGRIEFGVPGSHRPAELIVVSLLGDERDPVGAADRIAELALARLTDGGLLVVLARCGHSSDGVLSDPAGPVVAAAQTVDLLYLQHIIALHAPVRDGQFAVESLTERGGATDDEQARAANRAAVRGLPTPHRRVHSDVLVFAQPHQHEPPPVSPAEQAFDTGVIR